MVEKLRFDGLSTEEIKEIMELAMAEKQKRPQRSERDCLTVRIR